MVYKIFSVNLNDSVLPPIPFPPPKKKVLSAVSHEKSSLCRRVGLEGHWTVMVVGSDRH